MGLYFSFYLFKLGLAPPIQDLYGKVNFTGMCRETKGGLPPVLWGPMAGGMCGVKVLDVFTKIASVLAKPPVWGFSAPLLVWQGSGGSAGCPCSSTGLWGWC